MLVHYTYTPVRKIINLPLFRRNPKSTFIIFQKKGNLESHAMRWVDAAAAAAAAAGDDDDGGW